MELARHGSFSFGIALVVAIVGQIAWRILTPEVEAGWFYLFVSVLLAVVACMPNGMHWMLDISHVDLRGNAHFPYSRLFAADLIGALFGSALGLAGGRLARKRFRP